MSEPMIRMNTPGPWKYGSTQDLLAKIAELEGQLAEALEYKTLAVAGVWRDDKAPCGWTNRRAEGAEAKVAEQAEEIRLGREKYSQYRSEMTRELAEQAEYMRLAAIECKSLMEFRDEALRVNGEQAAIIERLTNMLTFLRKTLPEEYWDSNELAQIDEVLVAQAQP